MSLLALGLLVCSAFFHMGWNFLIKQTSERHIISWWALLAGALVLSPFPIAARAELEPVSGYVVASACFQMAYYILLGYAYQSGDFSLVYPIARGAAPIFITLWAALFLHELTPITGLIGIATIALGIVFVGFGAWQGQGRRALRPTAGMMAPFLIALCISGYSVIDGGAVKQAPPLPYTVFAFGLSGLFLTPLLWMRYGWPMIFAVGRRHWRRIVAVGAGTYAAYGMVLSAYSIAPVSYVGAVREMSIVLAALAGWIWLNESFGRVRTFGAVVMCVGILLVTVTG